MTTEGRAVHLDFASLTEWYVLYGYPILFAGVLLENLGVPVPGETAVLVAAFLASPAGGGRFRIEWVIAITVVAAVLGDNLGFWIGHRWARPRLQRGEPFFILTPKILQTAEGYFARYGVWTVFFARFVAALRVAGALAAGTAGMPWPRFLLANLAGAVAWATAVGLLGYFFGHSWELLHHWMHRGALILLGCVVLFVGLPYLLRRLRKVSPAVTKWPGSLIFHGLLVAFLEVLCLALLFFLEKSDTPSRLDRDIREWISAQDFALVDHLASVGTLLGSLPVTLGVTVLLVWQLWYRGRPWRETAVAAWALLASEAVGLLLFGLLRAGHFDVDRVVNWPYGFAALVPTRAIAVFGTAAYLVGLQNRTWGYAAKVAALLLTLLAGFGPVWNYEQWLSAVLLEYAVGGLVLFAGVWWLEGYSLLSWRKESAPAVAQVSNLPQ